MKRFILVTIASLCFGTMQSHAQNGAVPCVNHYVTNQHTTQHEFDAMVDFTFNVGCGNFRKSTLLKKMNAGDIQGAADEFSKWVYDVKHQKLSGLVRRRAQEKALFLTP